MNAMKNLIEKLASIKKICFYNVYSVCTFVCYASLYNTRNESRESECVCDGVMSCCHYDCRT